MDATRPSEATTPAPEPTTKDYKSRAAPAWCFRKSRDLWKAKYQALKVSFKRLTNRVADVTRAATGGDSRRNEPTANWRPWRLRSSAYMPRSPLTAGKNDRVTTR